MIETRKCEYCGKSFKTQRPVRKRFCNPRCAAAFRDNQPKKIPPGTIGAISEMVVCADLMRKGYQVFRCVSPNSSCDLIICRDDELIRVEVKTSTAKISGSTITSANKKNIFDVLALVIAEDEIVYCYPDGTLYEL